MLHGKGVVHPATVISSFARLGASISVKCNELALINVFGNEIPSPPVDFRCVRMGRKFVGRHKSERSKRCASDS
jgi:hypothetical protein